ncbi:hypothetical protein DRE_00966 [Drechslerella stenobrocha 248]|uniref:Uncharacterized protein n=1 Tax=Drechslerella stenobrocha 248 TaxID=1043628 RepID=W7HXP0_9PEZI|nr:hypothetical protein DRE_00966 [Drechslerella stenobrocha 248]
MVLSIPPPVLADLLPAFLSHIPASFASPKPPPSLPPLLTPLTRSRLAHLSFNLPSSAESSWLSLLTWSSDPADGQGLHDHLASQDYYFLHQEPSPATYASKGFRRLDTETLQALVAIPEIELLVVYQFTTDDSLPAGAWKAHDMRLADDEDVLLRAGSWHTSIDAAEDSFRSAPRFTSALAPAAVAGKQLYQDDHKNDDSGDGDDDDDYWGRYDDEDTESSAGDHVNATAPSASQQQSPVQVAASLLARRVLADDDIDMTKAEDEYYSRYANVEPVLDRGASSDTTTTTTATAVPAAYKYISHADHRRDSLSTAHTAATDVDATSETLSTPLTAFTQPSTQVSPLAQMQLKPEIASELERAAEVHTQSEIAIRQHVSTSIKSLYRLWKAGGLEAEDFGQMLEREVEVLRLVEEAGELGS